MAHACAARSVVSQPENAVTVYVDEVTAIPEDWFGADGQPTTVRLVGPGLLMENIDSDD